MLAHRRAQIAAQGITINCRFGLSPGASRRPWNKNAKLLLGHSSGGRLQRISNPDVRTQHFVYRV
jgi:hypothetical protein